MAKKMLVVVDYQNDFVDGTLGFPGAELLDTGIAKKVRKANENGDIVVVTLDTHGKNYLETREGRALPIEHCIRGTHGWELYGETGKVIIEMTENIVTLQKGTFGVSPADIVAFLNRYEVDEVEFVGLVTNMCVVSNVCCFQAMWPEAQMVVDAALVDSFDKRLHKATLDVLRGMQVKVIEDPYVRRAV